MAFPGSCSLAQLLDTLTMIREHLRGVKSYVTREGRMTPGQKNALQTLWPQYGIDLVDGRANIFSSFENEQKPEATVFHGKRVVEIGFGMGDSLFESARQNPDNLYIGIEPHRPGVGHLLQLIETSTIGNLKVVCGDAIEVLESYVLNDYLDVIQVFFPDPWPKKRHHKRRLINDDFVKLSVSKLKIGGKLLMATDWKNYAEAILSAAESNSCIVPCLLEKCLVEKCSEEKRVKTKYEKRGERLGHDIVDFAYIKEK